MVPGIGPSPDKMLLGRLFSYADTHRHRIGTNYQQLPVNAPKSPVNSYNRDGGMRYTNPADTVYAPNSYGGPAAEGRWANPGWRVAGEIVRAANTRRRDDDDFVQPRALYRYVLDDAARERLATNVANHLRNGVTPEVRDRAIGYWRQVDPDLGARVAKRTANDN